MGNLIRAVTVTFIASTQSVVGSSAEKTISAGKRLAASRSKEAETGSLSRTLEMISAEYQKQEQDVKRQFEFLSKGQRSRSKEVEARRETVGETHQRECREKYEENEDFYDWWLAKCAEERTSMYQ